MSDIEGRLDHEKEWPHGWDGERGHPPTLSWLWVVVIGLVVSCLMGSCEAARAEVSEVVLQTIAMEAADQPFEGQVAVASVILNRARRGNISPQSVVMRPKQFSCWNSHKWARTWLDKHYTPKVRQRALNALNQAIVGGMTDLTHYHHTGIRPYWAVGHTPSVVIGKHVFYEGIK